MCKFSPFPVDWKALCRSWEVIQHQINSFIDEINFLFWITGFLIFVHCLVFKEHNVTETGSVAMSGWETLILLGELERANLSHWTSSETMCSLEYLMLDRVQKLSNPKCCTQSLEPFRIYNYLLLIFRDPSKT